MERYYYDPESDLEYEVELEPPLDYSPEKDFRELDRFLQSHLTNLQVYAIGGLSAGEFDIYTLGNTQDGDWAGVLIDVQLNP